MMRSYKSLKLGASLIALLALAVSPARAADGTWAILIGGNWSTTNFWVDGIVADGADSTATFDKDITANRTVTLDTDRTIGHLFFRDSGGGTDHKWTLQSNTLTLETTTGRPTINIGSLASVPVYISTVLAGTNGFEKTGNGTLLMNGNNTYTGNTVLSSGNIRYNANDAIPVTSVLSMAGGTLQMMGYNQTLGGLDGTSGRIECSFNSGTNVLTLAVAGSQGFAFGGFLQDGHSLSQLNIVKTGTGTQAFTGANTYSGTTTVSEGTLIGGADGAFGTGSLTVADGATLVLAGGVSNTYIGAGATLVLGSSATLDLDFTGDANTIDGLSLDGGATWVGGGTYTAAALQAFGPGTYTGTGSLTVAGEAAVVIGDVGIQLLTGNDVSLTWTNTLGAAYGVQTNTDLVAGQWGTLQSGLTAPGGSISYTGTASAASTFYRIVVE